MGPLRWLGRLLRTIRDWLGDTEEPYQPPPPLYPAWVYEIEVRDGVDHLVLVASGSRFYRLPAWAAQLGLDVPSRWEVWKDPWHWPGHPLLEYRNYHAALTTEQLAALRTPPWPITLTHDTVAEDEQPQGHLLSDAVLSDRDLLSEDEQALFDQLAPAAPEKVVAYPPKVDEQEARDWVTVELKRRTGGLTRHPLDVTDYPEPPTEADLAAREKYRQGAVAMFSHGYSMRYLSELLQRAKAKDHTLTTEELMGLRARGLI